MYLYCQLTEQEKRIWDAYARMAASFDREDPEHPENFAQSNFSLWWYFAAVQSGTAHVNDLLRAFLSGARAAALPAGEDEPDWAAVMERTARPQLKQNPNQYKAISVALTQPISFIQGPPGTGKTETILNLLSCILAGGKTAAIVSSNNAAVENVVQKVKDAPEVWNILAAHLASLGNLRRRKRFSYQPRLNGLPHSFRFGPDPTAPAVPDAPDDGPDVGPDGPFAPNEPGAAPEPNDGLRAFEQGGVTMQVQFEPAITTRQFLAPENFPAVASSIHSLKKCFADGIDYQYDYLIMDEASQTDTLLGLMAMSCAKHLVLVGDLNQLPPVGEEHYQRAQEELCREGSFLKLCAQRLQTEENVVFLNWHFRCHPGIIGFCNHAVYEGRLKCMIGKEGAAAFPQLKERLDRYYTWQFGPGCTGDSFPIPIRVLWFRGDYSERHYQFSKIDRAGFPSVLWTSRTNRKQLEIFWREELPQLQRRLQLEPPEGMEPLSVVILCPYRGLLEELHRRMAEVGILSTLNNAPATEEERNSPLSELTIHRSQGREYDIVYFLPADDGTWEWPWSQKRNLINVAVSRAKRELRVIASTSLMPPYIQEALVGPDRVVPSGVDRRRTQESENELFLQKLMIYLWNRRDECQNEVFGFHESALGSIYDDVPILRGPNVFAPEQCMRKILSEAEVRLWAKDAPAPAGWSYRTEVHLCNFKDAQGRPLTSQGLLELLTDPANQAALTTDRIRRHLVKTAWRLLESKKSTYLGPRGGRFDFVLYLDGEPRLAIEVDGGFHREYRAANAAFDDLTGSDPHLDHRFNDLLKDWIAERMMGWPVLRGNCREELNKLDDSRRAMLRLPNDGSTFGEKASLRSSLVEKQVFSLEELLALLSGAALPQAAPTVQEEPPAPAAAAPTETQADRLCRDINFIEQLVEGVDPVTGAPLPADSILSDPAVRSVLFGCKAALERIVIHDVARSPFAPDPVLRETLRADSVSKNSILMADHLSGARNRLAHRKLNATTLLNYLKEGGYVTSARPYSPTAKGRDIGLCFSSQSKVVIFSPRSQQWLIDHLDDLAQYCATHVKKPLQKGTKIGLTLPSCNQLRRYACNCQSLSRKLHPRSGRPLAPSDPARAEPLQVCFSHIAQSLIRAAELGYYSAIRPFALTPKQWADLFSLVSDKPCFLRQLVDMINGQTDRGEVEHLRSAQLVEILSENGLITDKKAPPAGTPWHITPKGVAFGLTAPPSQESADLYAPLICSPELQRLLVSKLEKFVAY